MARAPLKKQGPAAWPDFESLQPSTSTSPSPKNATTCVSPSPSLPHRATPLSHHEHQHTRDHHRPVGPFQTVVITLPCSAAYVIHLCIIQCLLLCYFSKTCITTTRYWGGAPHGIRIPLGPRNCRPLQRPQCDSATNSSSRACLIRAAFAFAFLSCAELRPTC